MNHDYTELHYISMYFESFQNGGGRNCNFASVPVQSLHPVIPPLGLPVKLDLTWGKNGVKKAGNIGNNAWAHMCYRCCQNLRGGGLLYFHLTLSLKYQTVTFPTVPASLNGSSHIKAKYMVHRGD